MLIYKVVKVYYIKLVFDKKFKVYDNILSKVINWYKLNNSNQSDILNGITWIKNSKQLVNLIK